MTPLVLIGPETQALIVSNIKSPTAFWIQNNLTTRRKTRIKMTAAPSTVAGDGKFHFAIDRGGTFTDVFCRLPDGSEIVSKLLSEDPSHYDDAPTEGIRRVLEEHDKGGRRKYPRSQPVNTSQIGSIRMGTTVATNALLERDGTPMALLITKGFGDILEIGNQSRPDIFDLTCSKPSLLYEKVIEIDERVVLSQFCPTSENPHWKDYPKHTGLTGEVVQVVKEPDLDVIREEMEKLKKEGITALAICLMHGYTYTKHEQDIGKLAESMGCFDQISLSCEVMPMVKLVSRGHTCSAAAYLTPKITNYLASFKKGFDAGLEKVPLTYMKSDGGLAPVGGFGGHQAILSGPAGGVVGYAKTSFNTKDHQPVIGFDMGGTSTDVSRYDGQWELVFETVTAGVAIQSYVQNELARGLWLLMTLSQLFYYVLSLKSTIGYSYRRSRWGESSLFEERNVCCRARKFKGAPRSCVLS